MEDECVIEFPEQEKNLFQKVLDLFYFGSKIDAVDNESETDERREIDITFGDQFEKAMESKLENLRSGLRLELKEIRDEIKEDLEEKVEKILEKLN